MNIESVFEILLMIPAVAVVWLLMSLLGIVVYKEFWGKK
jgi:ABC-type proline/glycine betaine transport system permease subunit